MSRRALVLALLGALPAALLAAPPPPAHGKGGLGSVEAEFERAIARVSPCTVALVPRGVKPERIPGTSSGVVVSRSGLVLSDKDVGYHFDSDPGPQNPNPGIRVTDEIEVRIPDLKGRGYAAYDAVVLRRLPDLDSSLLKIVKPPSGLKHLELGDSDGLKVGDFTFAMGNAFGASAEVPPTLTAGVISALVPAEREPASGGPAAGRYAHIYTSAAVNQGVNGGPLVDAGGLLVGTVSSLMLPTDAANPFQFLGKVVPVARIRAVYAGVPEAAGVFDAPLPGPSRATESARLSEVFHATARRAGRAVASLEVKRRAPVNSLVPAGPGVAATPRYQGPVSGVVVSPKGHVLTSLYNLTNLGELSEPAWRLGLARLPEEAGLEGGLDAIESVQAHLADGRSGPASLVAWHEGLGLALFKAEIEGGPAPTLEPAPAAGFEAGRFALALGNPFGSARLPDPLLTVGILSKEHSADLRLPGQLSALKAPWAGMWQTDAGLADTNCGGAVVDLTGRLLGVAQVWTPSQHGRASGVGFVVPWSRIAPVLGALQAGRTFARALLGVTWVDADPLAPPVIATVIEGSSAARAGLQPGDRIQSIDGVALGAVGEAAERLRERWSGDEVTLGVDRGGRRLEVPVRLGRRGKSP